MSGMTAPGENAMAPSDDSFAGFCPDCYDEVRVVRERCERCGGRHWGPDAAGVRTRRWRVLGEDGRPVAEVWARSEDAAVDAARRLRGARLGPAARLPALAAVRDAPLPDASGWSAAPLWENKAARPESNAPAWDPGAVAPLDPATLRVHNQRAARGPDGWDSELIESLLSKGSEADIARLFAELRRDPFGPAAEAALEIAPRLKEHPWIYGEPRLIESCLARWRRA